MLRHDYRDGDNRRRRRYCRCSENVAVTVSAAAAVAASADGVGVCAPGRGMGGVGPRGQGRSVAVEASEGLPVDAPARLEWGWEGRWMGRRAFAGGGCVFSFIVIGRVRVNWHE